MLAHTKATGAIRLPDPGLVPIGTEKIVEPLGELVVIVPCEGGVVKTALELKEGDRFVFRTQAQSIGDGKIRHYWSW